MNYKQIIEDIGKYHYILVSGKKAGVLSSNNKASDAKKEALKKLKPKAEKLNKQIIIILKLSKISNKLFKQQKKEKIKLIGGPIKVEIKLHQLINGKLVKADKFNKDNKLYITDKFLSKNKKLTLQNMKFIASAALNNKLSIIAFAINTIDKLIKN